jgi:serine/threonine-protein kinase
VHGDVRPHNILTNPDGQVKLTDFGISEAIGAFPALRDNTLLRSVHYTAPEVLKGSNPHPASDIYSLGVVLFEMVTGSVPFDADSAMAIAAKHLSDKPPVPHEMNSAVPKPLSDIILRALAKNPSDRYQTAGQMLADLQKVRETLRTGVAAAPRSSKDSTVVVPQTEEAYADEEPEQDLKHILLVLLGIMFLTLVFVGGFFTFFKQVRSQQIKVPNLVGKTLEEAQEIAKNSHLELLEYRDEFNERFEAGTIYMTNPPPDGTVPRDKPQVKVWVSKGPRLARVPNLLGLTEREAIRRLEDAGFVVGKLNSDYSDNTEAGKVISQKPTSGEHREPLSAVSLVLSQGPKPEEPTPVEPDENTSAPEPKQFDVKVNVPAEGPDSQMVKIVVSDDESQDRVVYEQPRQPGEHAEPKKKPESADDDRRMPEKHILP